MVRTALLAIAWAGAFAVSRPAAADTGVEFLAFPSLRWAETESGARSDAGLSGTIDLFAAAESERLRFLGEWFFTENSNQVQRLQVGWRLGAEDTVWLGRYHTPVGYWNTEYHHGTYLQTSVSRPGIEEFESGHGPLPTHFTGLLAEGSTAVASGRVHYAVAVGAAPTLEPTLSALDVADPEGHHGLGAVVNLNWRPEAFDRRQLGIVLGRTQLHDPVLDSDFRQDLIGAYGNWIWRRLRLTGALFHLSGRFEGSLQSESFHNGYLQAEWHSAARWTPYARVEATGGIEPADAFIGRFRRFVQERELVGLRWDVSERQALTLEVSRFETQADRGERIALQWSAYFP